MYHHHHHQQQQQQQQHQQQQHQQQQQQQEQEEEEEACHFTFPLVRPQDQWQQMLIVPSDAGREDTIQTSTSPAIYMFGWALFSQFFRWVFLTADFWGGKNYPNHAKLEALKPDAIFRIGFDRLQREAPIQYHVHVARGSSSDFRRSPLVLDQNWYIFRLV